jgi:hypothetical protein
MFAGKVKKVNDQLAWIIQLDDLGGDNGTIIIRISDIHHIIENPVDFYRDQLNTMIGHRSHNIIEIDADDEFDDNSTASS